MERNYLKQLKNKRGQLIGMTIGSGMFYRYAEISGFDFIVIATASRFRHMGINSLSASMPYSNANEMAFDFANREILTLYPPTLPIFFGFCATDPTIDMDTFFDKLKEAGFSGICNIPTVLIMDGDFRVALERSGFSYKKEVDAVRLAHEKGLLTIAMVQDDSQAKEMINAGCDILCMHFGASKGGVFGARKELTLEKATEMANNAYAKALSLRNDVLLTFYGGPSKTTSSIKYLLTHTKADGFIGGYSIERMMYEETVSGVSVQEFFWPQSSEGAKKLNYVEAMKKYIENNYPSQINIQEIAGELHVSRSHLSRLFRKEVGITYQEYLTRYRIDKAISLLRNTDMPTAEVAYAVGYHEPAHFSKIFKKRTTFSPSQFRKRAQNNNF